MSKFTPEQIEDLNEHIVLDTPYSSWYCTVAGVSYTPLKGQEPNWFHRKMQGLCFGVVWKRLGKETEQ